MAERHGRSRKFRLGNMAKSMFGNKRPEGDKNNDKNSPETTAFRKFEMPSINTANIDMAEFMHTARSDESLYSSRSDAIDNAQYEKDYSQGASPRHERNDKQQDRFQQQRQRHEDPVYQSQASRFDNSRFRKVNAYGENDKAAASNSSVGGDYGGTGASYGSTDRSSYGSGRGGTDRFGSGRGYDGIPARDGHVPHVVMDDLDEDMMEGILSDAL